jgi:hypothetical protein
MYVRPSAASVTIKKNKQKKKKKKKGQVSSGEEARIHLLSLCG